jgi:hypothetical protein
MATEEKLKERVTNNYGLRRDGNIRHSMLLEQSREPTTDPAVFEVIAERARY